MRLGSSYHSRGNRCGPKNAVVLRELILPQSAGSPLHHLPPPINLQNRNQENVMKVFRACVTTVLQASW